MNFLLKPFSFIDPSTLALPFMFILMGIEILFNTKNNLDIYDKKDTYANITLIIGLLAFSFFGRIIIYYYFDFFYQHRFYEIPVTWWAWILLLFADDFTFYWHHRWHHEIRILWAVHVVHHSSQKLNLSTPFREPWIIALYYNVLWFWLPLIGFQPWMVICMVSINQIYQFWTHASFIGKLGFLEWFMNTPSHHRVHHASNVQYLDKNHAGIFIIWDRIFGTFQEEKEKPLYGITNNINFYNPIKINFHEYGSIWKDFQKTESFINKIKYLILPPGWSHDGSSKTAKQLQKEINND